MQVIPINSEKLLYLSFPQKNVSKARFVLPLKGAFLFGRVENEFHWTSNTEVWATEN